MSLVVACQHVAKFFRHKAKKITALSEVSLQLEPGEFVAIRGKSGCGKSTLLLTLGGLQKPDRGTVLVEDHDFYALTARQRAAKRAAYIGFVFQQFHLIPYLSVLENILSAGIGQGGAPSLQQRAGDLVDRLGLSERIDHVPAKLSHGRMPTRGTRARICESAATDSCRRTDRQFG